MAHPRRAVPAAIAVTMTAIAVGAAPATALAQPDGPSPVPTITVVPERPAPDGVTTFTDDPAVVDTHPQAIESWNRLPQPDVVAVNFTTGTPECFGVHADVQETVDLVAIKLRSGTLPEAVGRACIMIGVVATLPVRLSAPVGSRAVVSIT